MNAAAKLVTFSSKRQITIPKAMRETLGINPGGKVVVTVHRGGGVAVQPVPTAPDAPAGARSTHPRQRRHRREAVSG